MTIENGKAEKWFKYLCLFEMDGSEFMFEIWAKDQDDAKRRVEAIGTTGKVEGLIHSTLPA